MRNQGPSVRHRTCAPNAMGVVLDVLGAVEVNHMLHPRDVNAAARHVGTHQHVVHTLLEVVQCLCVSCVFVCVQSVVVKWVVKKRGCMAWVHAYGVCACVRGRRAAWVGTLVRACVHA